MAAAGFLLLLMFLLGISAQAAGLNKTKAAVNVKKTIKLKVTGASGKVTWSSGNKKIATVSAKGVVKGVRKGTAVITAKAGGSVWKCKVTVKQPVTKVVLNKSTSYVYAGGISHLKASCKPANANNKKVTWKSSNPKVAKVSAKGVITGVKPGTCTITATAKDGSKKKAKCKVTVEKFEYYGHELEYYIQDENESLSSIKTDGFWTPNLRNESGRYPEIKGYPTLARRMETGESTPTYSFQSSNPGVIKVNQSGDCTPVAEGTAVITTKITGGYGKGAVCKTPAKVTDMRITPYLQKVDLTTANFSQYFGSETIDRHDTWGTVTGQAVVLTNKKNAEGLYYYASSKDFAVEVNVQIEHSWKAVEYYEETETDSEGNPQLVEKSREVTKTDTVTSTRTLTHAPALFYEGLFEKNNKENAYETYTFKSFQVNRVRGSIYLVKKAAVIKSEVQSADNGELYQVLTLKNGAQITLRMK